MLSSSAANSQSRLPPEIWTEIFSLASNVPGLMDTDIPDPFSEPNYAPSGQCIDVKSVKTFLRTSLAMALVCKHWHSIALPNLYRCVLVQDGRSGESLCRALRASKSQAGHPSRALGSRTRHLVLDLQVQSELMTFGSGLMPWDFKNLPEIVACLPNLQILSASINISAYVSRTPYYGAEFARALTGTCGASFRKLHLDQNSIVLFAPQDGHAILSAMPQLRMIVGGDASFGCPSSWPELPHLSSLSGPGNQCGTCQDVVAAHHTPTAFPSLRTATFRLRYSTDTGAHFLALYGPQLTSVHVELWKGCARFLDALRTRCPRLEDLRVTLDSEDDAAYLRFLPPVRRLGLALGHRVLHSAEAQEKLSRTVHAAIPSSVEEVRVFGCGEGVRLDTFRGRELIGQPGDAKAPPAACGVGVSAKPDAPLVMLCAGQS
ncbi:hypothetical protein EWM64_g2412 [Hericium alpestre]|uniref:Uncharacterized protein n=1 Tax=Hericium alpestre TaxID=135208 RepID=A0A4Z0A577_9AGAM|nr:hypothetical protein EWM64_g2412 [Hericium alpestre]